MVLPLTTTSLPWTDGPPHGLRPSGARHFTLPVAPSRRYRARSPTFSLSRKAVATRTASPLTATGASTCHFLAPCCHSLTGAGLGSWSSDGGTAKQGSFFLSSSYLAFNSAHFLSRSFL